MYNEVGPNLVRGTEDFNETARSGSHDWKVGSAICLMARFIYSPFSETLSVVKRFAIHPVSTEAVFV